MALAVADVEGSSADAKREGGGIPAARNESQHLTMVQVRDVNDADCVVIRVGDKQQLSRGIEFQGVRRRPLQELPE